MTDSTLQSKGIGNVADLTSVLSRMQTKKEDSLENTNSTYKDQNEPLQQSKQRTSSKTKSGIQGNSTADLLNNLAGINSITNTKLEVLDRSVSALTNSIQTVISNQETMIELLSTIARNTMQRQPESSGTTTPIKVKSGLPEIRDYGYTSSIAVLSDLIRKLIIVAEHQISASGKRYSSSRDNTIDVVRVAVEVACKSDFRIDGNVQKPLTVPDAKSESVRYVASRIGKVNNIEPTMNGTSFKELLEDGKCRTFINIMSDVISRLKIIRYLMCYYEGDIVCSLEQPYFDTQGNIIYNSSKVKSRVETPDEGKIIESKVTQRKDIGRLIAKGASPGSAIKAILRDG